uniref:Uncharacterized protein n=1 Tax=Neogobius melanostomus TaxID=47308 RepID=A0A8C6V663_9GOBI
ILTVFFNINCRTYTNQNCLGEVEQDLKYIKGEDTTFQFDLCDVIDCGGDLRGYQGYDIHVCAFLAGGPLGEIIDDRWCPYWRQVFWGTGVHYVSQGYITPHHNENFRDLQFKGALERGTLTAGSNKHNPLLFTGDKSIIYFILGVDKLGTDTKGIFKISLLDPQKNLTNTFEQQEEIVTAYETSKITPKQMIKAVTGFEQSNIWLDNIYNKAKETGKSDCVVCSGPRPNLLLVRTPMEENPDNLTCIMDLMMNDNPCPKCIAWAIFPVAPKELTPPVFTPGVSNVTCFTKRGGSAHKCNNYMGGIGRGSCRQIIDVSGWANATTLTVARADVWWYCGEATLFNYLPSDWEGTCALVSLISPIGILDITAVDIMRTVEDNGIQLRGEKHQWAKRSMVQLPSESAVYFDAIGVPRGIPDEYKLVDEVAEGINYVHYNVQRVAHFTVKGFHAIHEQLSATSIMAYQNRVALDLVLAKEGGVCAWFQGQCCTFIPNNTAPDGTLTMALHGLRALSEEMRAVSGAQSWLSQWLGRMFGRWAEVVQAIGVPFLICLFVLGFGGCCCIPLTRGLTMRAIDAAVNKRIGDKPPPYQLSQLEHTQLDTRGREILELLIVLYS